MKLFLISPDQIEGQVATLNATESHHLLHVLRKKKGDILFLSDGQGQTFEAKILENQEPVIVEILSIKKSVSKSPRLILCQAILKNPRMDWLVEKATELGVHTLLPFLSERSTVKCASEKDKSSKIKRWQRIAEAALKQSQQSLLPQIGPILSLQEICEKYKKVDALKILLNPPSPNPLPQGEGVRRRVTVMLIGPEGGFTAQELKMAEKAGFVSYSLGHHTLRAETAAISALAILNFMKLYE